MFQSGSLMNGPDLELDANLVSDIMDNFQNLQWTGFSEEMSSNKSIKPWKDAVPLMNLWWQYGQYGMPGV